LATNRRARTDTKCANNVSNQNMNSMAETGALRKKLLSPFHHPHLTSRNFVLETPGEKPGGSRAARVVGAALGVSKMKLREMDLTASNKRAGSSESVQMKRLENNFKRIFY
jgi:hypothetical protein